ncbi:MAG TPA: hypothetical protein VMD53_20070 [Rhizomicrobium sp.]|nr:hypothetical protein [Rhizomicrobium sp.]
MSPIQYEKWTAQRIFGAALVLGVGGYSVYQIIQSVIHESDARYGYGIAFGLMGVFIPLISVRKSRDFIARHPNEIRFIGWGIVLLTLLSFGWLLWSMDKRSPANSPLPLIICMAVAGVVGYLIARTPGIVRDILGAKKSALAKKKEPVGLIVSED